MLYGEHLVETRDALVADVRAAQSLVSEAEAKLERAIAGRLSERFIAKRQAELADAVALLAEAEAAADVAQAEWDGYVQAYRRQVASVQREMRARARGVVTPAMRAELDAERRANAW